MSDNQPELHSIGVKGFKGIADIDVPLRAINIVIGPNGSGKSNFLGAFSFLQAIREGHLQDYVSKAGGAEKILHFGSKTTKKLQIYISFEGRRNEYTIELQPTDTD